MTKSDLYERERAALREELHNLKGCQITFLTHSVTATGVLLGLGASLGSTAYPAVVFLFPVIVLLPSWWVFFDKATTITRVVGYYRVLEQLMLGNYEADFVGWENALGEFRRRQIGGRLIPADHFKTHGRLSCLRATVSLTTGHRYWVISNWTFLSLATLCLTLATLSLIKNVSESSAIASTHNVVSISVILVAGLLLSYSIYANAKVVQELIHGRNSYDCNEEFWKEILNLRPIDDG